MKIQRQIASLIALIFMLLPATGLCMTAVEYYNSGKDQKQYPEAMKDYSSAIAINPDYYLAYNNRGNIFKKQKQYPEAIRDFTRAVEFSLKAVSIKEDANTLDTLAAAYVEDQQYEKAVETYTKAIENSSSRIKKYQESLKEKGYYSGPVNGIKMEQLEQAIKVCVNKGIYL